MMENAQIIRKSLTEAETSPWVWTFSWTLRSTSEQLALLGQCEGMVSPWWRVDSVTLVFCPCRMLTALWHQSERDLWACLLVCIPFPMLFFLHAPSFLSLSSPSCLPLTASCSLWQALSFHRPRISYLRFKETQGDFSDQCPANADMAWIHWCLMHFPRDSKYRFWSYLHREDDPVSVVSR